MATPVRNTRARSGASNPLPVASTHPSNAYGSRGSGNVTSQTAGPAGLSEAMPARRRITRAAAESREASAEAVEATPSRAKGKRAAAPRPPSPIREESPRAPSQAYSEDQPESAPGGTAIDVVAPYERPRSARRSPSQASEEELAPSGFTVLLHTILRSLNSLFRVIKRNLLICSLVASSIFAALAITWYSMPILPTKRLELQRERILRGLRIIGGLPEWEQPPAGLEANWLHFKHQKLWEEGGLPDFNVPRLQWAINVNFLERIQVLERKTDVITDALNNVKKDVEGLLPRMIVVNEIGDRLQITDDLYTALQARLRGDEQLWQSFIEANEKRIAELMDDRLTDSWTEALSGQHIVNAQTALEMIKSENGLIQDLLDKKLASDREAFIKDVRGIAEEAVMDVLAKNTKAASASHDELAKAFFIENTLEEMRKVNFFSPKAGARINHRLTSPTARRKQSNILAEAWYRFFYSVQGPIYALLDWRDYADSWCASPSTDKGKAQIAVLTSREVYPSELVIENIPSSGTLYAATAPREVELWMDVGHADEVAAIKTLFEQHSLQYNSYGGCGDSPGETFVCVGRGKYDIHHENWVQKIPVFLPAEEYNIRSTHWVVRVKNNWGGAFTCLYKLRLQGFAEAKP